jgi:selenide,water dikinase
MQKKLGRNNIVLLGVGHTNAHVLRMWKMQPLADSQLICVSNFPSATYSGMLPGVLAGQYPVSAMEIDLVRFCQSAGARLVVGEVTGLDLERKRLEFRDRPPLAYGLLSIGIGSRPTFSGVEVANDAALVAVKPMQTFLPRLQKKIDAVRHSNPNRPVKIAIVGGGIGSLEIAFCLQARLLSDKAEPPVELSLVTGSDRVGSGLSDATQRTVEQHLNDRGIQSHSGQRVKALKGDSIELTNGEHLNADIVIWATSAAAPDLLQKFDLPKDDRGFLATRKTLQVVNHDQIFAVGDSGTIQADPTLKAGVFAVRQGPVLWDNIRRSIWRRRLVDYVPQKRFLKLINTADGKSIAEYGSISRYAGWAWRLKDRIDRRFMAMYQNYEPMPMEPVSAGTDDEHAMRCLGCGGKIGSELLGDVLADLEVPDHPDVQIGLKNPDDAAVMNTHDNRVTVTTDFFASPLDDPYLTGRIALLNSASDCFVMGAQPTGALAMVQLPLGHPRGQKEVMRELMAGSVEELRKMDATIVGGHSIEGPRLLAGFTVLGRQLTDPMTKGMLKPGDNLVLSKALGTGVALAALMQCQLPGPCYVPLVESMLKSNQIALRLITEGLVSGITDVTGFGLAGHLAEMLDSSNLSAQIHMSDIPLLNGCQQLIDQGIESTLTPDNRVVASKVELQVDDVGSHRHAALFDPQTCGGLLMGVGDSNLESVLKFLRESGFVDATVIGSVNESRDGKNMLAIK